MIRKIARQLCCAGDFYSGAVYLLQMASPSNKIQIIKYAPPPPELPTFGGVRETDVSFIGRTNYVAALEEKKSEVREVTRDFQYLAKWDIVPKNFAAIAALNQVAKAHGWDREKKQ